MNGVRKNGTREIFFKLFFAAFLISCSQASDLYPSQKKQEKIDAIRKGFDKLQDGDLVLRTGRDFTSSLLRRFSLSDQTYSHCGIIRIENGQTWVYHAIGGETNPETTIQKESFASFCNPQDNLGFGIFRYDLDSRKKKKLDSLVLSYYQEHIPFDMKFDMDTDSSLYCSEFIYKIISEAADKHYLPITHIGRFKYVAIDNLFVNDHTQTIYKTVFQ